MPGPQAAQDLQMPHPRDWQGGQIPRSSPAELGAAGIDWCIIFVAAIQLFREFKKNNTIKNKAEEHVHS